MTLEKAIQYLDSSIRHDTPVHKEFLIEIQKLLKECRDGYSERKDKECS